MYVYDTGCVSKPEDTFNFLVYLFIASRDQTQVIKLARHVLVLAEPPHLPLQKKKIFLPVFVVATTLGGGGTNQI